jgi:hypothetical protein
MLNPAFVEMAARDRIADMQRVSTTRSFGARSYLAADTTTSQTPPAGIRHARCADLQRAIGWFLVSVGLRLALPRARAGSGR